MALRVYTDGRGFKRVYEAPANLVGEKIKQGVLVGPPDLSPVIEDEDLRRKLNNSLCDLNILDYESMNGRRDAVHGLLRKLFKGAEPRETKAMLIGIIAIYQQEYYG